MGRPKLQIDAEQVEKLASIHCTMNEIAAIMGCSVDTLENRFSDVIEKGRDKGKASLRRLQWQTAQSGSAAMQIWLGKQLLGQRDRHETSSDPAYQWDVTLKVRDEPRS